MSEHKGVREIIYEGVRIALVIRAEAKGEGKTLFFSNVEDGFQLALAEYSSGHHVKAHSHQRIKTAPSISQEWIFMRDGRCTVSLFQKNGDLIEAVELYTGDGILIYEVIHELDSIEKSDILLLKQGPFDPNNPKNELDSH